MPMMFGFGERRRQLLEAEVRRIAGEAATYGALRAYLVGDLASGRCDPDTEIELVLVQMTDEPFHRRADFWVGHLRPRVGVRFLVYTPEEFDELEESDMLLLGAQRTGEVLVG
jgi:hypothetical protein